MDKFEISVQALDMLMPMFLVIDDAGTVQHTGPTLRKICGEVEGQNIFEIFTFERPGKIAVVADLLSRQGQKLHLAHRSQRDSVFKAQACELNLQGSPFVLLKLSMGISVQAMVERYHLTSHDFAPTELTMEMLYLIEAKSAVMGELNRLNHHLYGEMSEARLEATTDSLTGLRNRRALEQAMSQGINADIPCGVVYLDLDDFKEINDTRGHGAGDFVLQSVAAILQNESRDHDLVARLGGDEFVVALCGVDDADVLESRANRIARALAHPLTYAGQKIEVSASIGIALSKNCENLTPERLLAHADQALYVSKQHSGSHVTLYRPGTFASVT